MSSGQIYTPFHYGMFIAKNNKANSSNTTIDDDFTYSTPDDAYNITSSDHSLVVTRNLGMTINFTNLGNVNYVAISGCTIYNKSDFGNLDPWFLPTINVYENGVLINSQTIYKEGVLFVFINEVISQNLRVELLQSYLIGNYPISVSYVAVGQVIPRTFLVNSGYEFISTTPSKQKNTVVNDLSQPIVSQDRIEQRKFSVTLTNLTFDLIGEIREFMDFAKSNPFFVLENLQEQPHASILCYDADMKIKKNPNHYQIFDLYINAKAYTGY
jgi:hypothetical protein